MRALVARAPFPPPQSLSSVSLPPPYPLFLFPFALATQANKHLTSLIWSVRTASYGSSFLPSLFSWPACFAEQTLPLPIKCSQPYLIRLVRYYIFNRQIRFTLHLGRNAQLKHSNQLKNSKTSPK